MGLRVFWKQATSEQAHASLDEFQNDLRGGILRLCSLPD
jgi:hypothetical protein